MESELRQHYELENAQSCAKWKRFHLKASEAHRKLAQQIEKEAQQLCKHLSICYEPPADFTNPLRREHASADSSQKETNRHQDEDEFRLQIADDWIQQERFNIQEAFTNQTKKIQSDFQTFMDQLDIEFAVQRQRILDVATTSDRVQRVKARAAASSIPQQRLLQGSQRRDRQYFDKQFKSNAKRQMLVHTAPVVDPSTPSQDSWLLLSSPSDTSHNDNRNADISGTQQQLDRLQASLDAMKEVCPAKCVGDVSVVWNLR